MPEPLGRLGGGTVTGRLPPAGRVSAPVLRRLGQAGGRLLECLDDFGIRKSLGHLNLGLDLDGRPELLHAQVLLLCGDEDHTHVDVRPSRDGVLVESRAGAEIQRLLQDFPRFLEFQIVVGIQGLLVEGRDLLDIGVIVVSRCGAGIPGQRAKEEDDDHREHAEPDPNLSKRHWDEQHRSGLLATAGKVWKNRWLTLSHPTLPVNGRGRRKSVAGPRPTEARPLRKQPSMTKAAGLQNGRIIDP